MAFMAGEGGSQSVTPQPRRGSAWDTSIVGFSPNLLNEKLWGWGSKKPFR